MASARAAWLAWSAAVSQGTGRRTRRAEEGTGPEGSGSRFGLICRLGQRWEDRSTWLYIVFAVDISSACELYRSICWDW